MSFSKELADVTIVSLCIAFDICAHNQHQVRVEAGEESDDWRVTAADMGAVQFVSRLVSVRGKF